jgi:hypothetical protein
MIKPDVTGWKPLGQHGNSRYFVPDEGILAVVPNEGTIDTAETALENQAYQHAYFRTQGRPGVVVIYFDLIKELNKDARSVYTKSDPRYLCGVALVGGTLLSRAMASFFMGIISPPPIPLKMLPSTEDALRWAKEQLARRPPVETKGEAKGETKGNDR